MPLGGCNVPNRDDIRRMEKLSQKILSYEFNNKNKSNPVEAPIMEKTPRLDQTTSQSPTNTLALFRKYLHDKADQAMGKAYAQQCEANRRQPKFRRNMIPLKIDANLSREPTSLEKRLISGASPSSRSSSSSSSSKSQLTIFYSGGVNVYNNVSAEKAQAIMLLAGECSTSDPLRATTPTSSTLPMLMESQSEFNNQTDLPVARKHSLRRFIERRRDRIDASSPYAYGTARPDVNKAATVDIFTRKQTVSKSTIRKI